MIYKIEKISLYRIDVYFPCSPCAWPFFVSPTPYASPSKPMEYVYVMSLYI